MNLPVFDSKYLIVALGVIFIVGKYFWYAHLKSKMMELVHQGALVVDVRNPKEYEKGHKAGSLNIPLKELDKSLPRLDKGRNIILCCASGTRSAIAEKTLRGHGYLKVYSAGPWTNTLDPKEAAEMGPPKAP